MPGWTSPEQDADLREQWQLLGVDPDQARAANQQAASEQALPESDYELAPELWDAWRCLLATWNQWRVITGWAGIWYQGIDHQSLYACMQMLGIKPKHQAQVFQQVQILENEARELRNQKE